MRDGALERDPMCGREVQPTAPEQASYKSRTYHFCSARCRERFLRKAERMRAEELARAGALFSPTRPVFGLA